MATALAAGMARGTVGSRLSSTASSCTLDDVRQSGLQARRELGRAGGAAIAPLGVARGRRPLLTEAKHTGAIAGADKQGRDRAPLNVLLKIESTSLSSALTGPAGHDMTTAGASLALGEPVFLCL